AYERARERMENEQTPNPNAEAATDGSAEVQKPEVPKRGRGRPKKSDSNAGSRAAGNLHVPVSDVQRDRDPNQTKLSPAGQSAVDRGGAATEKRGHLTRPKENGHASAVYDQAQRNTALLGFSAFMRYIEEAPLTDALTLYNDFTRRIIDAGDAIEKRRTIEKQTENSCSFCDHVFTYRGTDSYHGRRAFDLAD